MAPMTLEEARIWRREQMKRQEALWLSIAETPFSIIQQLAAIATHDWDDVFVQGENGEPRFRDWDDMTWKGKIGLTSITVTETTLADGSVKRTIKATRDDKLKAISMLKDWMELHTYRAFKPQEIDDSKKGRGLYIDLKDESRVYTIDDVDEKSEIARLLDE